MSKKKRIIICTRICILIAGYIFVWEYFWSIQKALLALISRIMNSKFSIWLYLLIYVLRPYTLIPVGRLSTTAGVFWGRWPGLAIGLGWEMLSACVAFQNGRMIWSSWLEHRKEEWFGKFSFMLLRYPILAVTLSRMSPLPDDVVNYGRWMLRISRFTYFRGSVFGNMLFSVLNIMMGVQIDPEKLLTEWLTGGINRPIFILTIGVYLTVLLVSWLVFRRITKENKKTGT